MDAFTDRSFETIAVEDLNNFLVRLIKTGIPANTVPHNAVIIAQFLKQHARGGILRHCRNTVRRCR
jgi:hypothetical protein